MLLDLRVPILQKPGVYSRARHYPRGTFTIESGAAGARASGVALERAMLSYFCVEPHTRWTTHSHESEQITLVLKGELFFELGEEEVLVKECEAIAIPSRLPHAVFTRASCAEAVDAWSLVTERFTRTVEATSRA
jgi:quercetin dioxygenase-like cupin family protein